MIDTLVSFKQSAKNDLKDITKFIKLKLVMEIITWYSVYKVIPISKNVIS